MYLFESLKLTKPIIVKALSGLDLTDEEREELTCCFCDLQFEVEDDSHLKYMDYYCMDDKDIAEILNEFI